MVSPRISAMKNTTRKLRTVTRAPLHQFTAVVDAAVQNKHQHKHSAPCKYTAFYSVVVFSKSTDQRTEILRGEAGDWRVMKDSKRGGKITVATARHDFAASSFVSLHENLQNFPLPMIFRGKL
jgi:hypothetical protein